MCRLFAWVFLSDFVFDNWKFILKPTVIYAGLQVVLQIYLNNLNLYFVILISSTNDNHSLTGAESHIQKDGRSVEVWGKFEAKEERLERLTFSVAHF